MNELTTVAPSETNLAVNNEEMERAMRKAAGPSFLQAIRLVYATSDAFKNKIAKENDWMLGSDVNLGQNPVVVVGPRRYTAMRLKNNSMDLISHNLTKDSRYDAVNNDWIFPSGFTNDWLEIMQKKVPDQGQKVVNLIGFEHLLYLPEHLMFGVYYVAKTAYTMTSIKDQLKINKGKTGALGNRLQESKTNSWYLPTFTLLTADKQIAWPETQESLEAIEKFLNPGVFGTTSESNGGESRPR